MSKVKITGIPELESMAPIQEDFGPANGPQVKITGTPEETYGESAIRNVATLGKGVAQRLGGFGGDVASLPRLGLQKAFQHAPKGNIEGLLGDVESKLGPEAAEEMRGRIEQPPEFRGPLAGLTSKAVGKGIESVSQDLFGVDPSYFKPKGAAEKILHSSAKDAASAILPLLYGGPVGLGMAAVEAIAPNLVKFGAKAVGAGKETQRLAKGATQLLTGVYRLFTPKKAAGAIYNEIEKSVPRSLQADFPKTAQQLKKIDAKLRVGRLEPEWKAALRTEHSRLERIQRTGEGSFRDTLADKRALSSIISSRKTPAQAKPFFIDLQKAMKADLYAADVGKDVVKKLKWADSIYRDVSKHAKSFRAIGDFVKTSKGKAVVGVGGLGTIAGLVLGLNYAPKATLQTLGVALGIGGGIKTMDFLSDSIAMKKYYGKVLALAAKNKPQQLGIAIRKLDDGLTKEFGDLNKKN